MSPANIVEMLTEVGINPADGDVSYEGMKPLVFPLNVEIF